MKTYKRYRVPFVVETSKLNRLLSVARERLNNAPGIKKEKFEVRSSRNRAFETESFDEVLALDNPTGNRVESFAITCKAVGDDNKHTHLIGAEFDGSAPVDISLFVESEEPKWAADTFSAIEEQVERMIQTSPLAKLRSSLLAEVFLPFIALVLLLGIAAFALRSNRMSEHMWLSQDDIRQLSQTSNSPPQGLELYQNITKRQMRNLTSEQAEGFIPSKYRDWRILVIAIPILVAIGAIAYLYSACYPTAVFAWGDAEDWYDGIVQKRKTIWSILIGSLAIGVIGNLFVFGLTTFPNR